MPPTTVLIDTYKTGDKMISPTAHRHNLQHDYAVLTENPFIQTPELFPGTLNRNALFKRPNSVFKKQIGQRLIQKTDSKEAFSCKTDAGSKHTLSLNNSVKHT